jgi:uncharacterized protein
MGFENVLFKRTYAGEESREHPGKPLSSTTVAMVTNDPASFSDMHRLPTDEVWHFYLGDPVELLLLDPSGIDQIVTLGQNVLAGEHVQFVVRAGTWMGARLRRGGTWGVYGNTMAPGFVDSDFDRADPRELAARWPHHRQMIYELSRER